MQGEKLQKCQAKKEKGICPKVLVKNRRVWTKEVVDVDRWLSYLRCLHLRYFVTKDIEQAVATVLLVYVNYTLEGFVSCLLNSTAIYCKTLMSYERVT